MKNSKYLLLTFCILVINMIIPRPSICQDEMKTQNIMLVIDGSSYSNHHWKGVPKIKRLRQSLGEALAEVNKTPAWGYNMGVRIYGDRSERDKNDCMDTRLASKIDWFEPSLIAKILEGIKPKGRNCLTNALPETQKEFSTVKPGAENFIVCILSAPDECAGLERVTIDWTTNNAHLKATYIIGMNVNSEYAEKFDTIFESFPGKFINLKNPEKLTPTLVEVLNVYCRGIEPTPVPKENKGK